MMKKVLVSYNNSTAVERYANALRLVGIEPLLSASSNPASLDEASGLLLTGGVDVSPALYGEAPHNETEPPDDERDAVELRLIAESLDRDLPLFAICRGLQILNVQHGGTLIQHLAPLARHCKRSPERHRPAHQVHIQPNTLLASIAGSDTWEVNSRHHQAVKRVGDGLVVSAIDAQDGIVEALEHPGKRFVVAVQWHPEDQALVGPEQLKLFQSFAEAL